MRYNNKYIILSDAQETVKELEFMIELLINAGYNGAVMRNGEGRYYVIKKRIEEDKKANEIPRNDKVIRMF